MADTALLVIDVLNAYDHEDADALAEQVEPTIGPVTRLIQTATESADIDLVYVNDNYGDFSAGAADLVQAAREGRRPDLIEPLVPGPDCAFLTKVRHSAFYATPLAYLLNRHGTKRIVLTGQVTEQCILYTALDGYLRHFDVIVPRDAVAAIIPELGEAALKMMERNMGAELCSSEDCL